MTLPEVKEMLNEYQYRLEYIKCKEQEMGELKSKIEIAAPNILSIKNTKPQNFKEELMCKCLDLEKEKKKLFVEAQNIKAYIENIISLIKQPFRNILYFKFVAGKDNNRISAELGYSASRIYQLIQEGIKLVIEESLKPANGYVFDKSFIFKNSDESGKTADSL